MVKLYLKIEKSMNFLTHDFFIYQIVKNSVIKNPLNI